MEGRRDQFVAEVMAAEGIGRQRATRLTDAAIDRWVWYAGWADKFGQVSGTVNPVERSYFNFSVPEPSGVVGVIAPEGSSLLGLVSRLAPVIVSGNCAVVLASESWVAVNVVLATRAWDPYPFILLNLFLSMLAALQAPIIMMSQNRQDAKDRVRSELDFAVNRKAEAEIIQLAAKLNRLEDRLDDLARDG